MEFVSCQEVRAAAHRALRRRETLATEAFSVDENERVGPEFSQQREAGSSFRAVKPIHKPAGGKDPSGNTHWTMP